jgi:hypothetical protein
VSDSTKFLITCGSRGIEKCEAMAYQITARQQAAKILELEAELSFYANCSYSSNWVIGDKNHVMEDCGDRASNYLFNQAGKA